MKLACEMVIQGTQRFALLTTANNLDVGQFVKSTPGVGQPFYCWPSTPAPPAGKRWVACDFTDAPLVDTDAAVNNAAITAMASMDPATVLIAG